MSRINFTFLSIALFVVALTGNWNDIINIANAQSEKVIQKTAPPSTKPKVTENDVFVAAVINDDFVHANNLIDKIIADNPDTAYYKYVKSYILLNFGKNEEALALYDKELEKNSQNAEMLACKAHYLLIKGDKSQALEMIYEALCLNYEQSILVNIKRAQIYDAIGQCDYAFKIISNIDMSKEFAKPHISFLEYSYCLQYAMSAVHCLRYHDARICIDRLIKKNNNIGEAWSILAQINMQVSPNEVLECLDKAENLHFDSYSIFIMKVRFYITRNDYERAERLYDERIQQMGDLDLNESLRYVSILINCENMPKAREVFSKIKVDNKVDIIRKKIIELNLLTAEHKWQEARELVYDMRKNYQSMLTEVDKKRLITVECLCECGLKTNRALELINKCIEEGIFPLGKSNVFND